MHSRWNEAEAASFVAEAPAAPSELMLRVYTSRLLGTERSLVLHGGGNTSVKTQLADLHGTLEDVLFVKGSGSDLASVAAADFCAVRLNPVRQLAHLTDLDNAALASAVSTSLARPAAHKPSIETLLHALLPWKFVEHTHADAVLAITNTSNGAAIAREVFADLAPLVPFRASGFALAKACAQAYAEQAGPRTIGLILLHHGVFAFGNSARASYENMLHLVTLAEDYLQKRSAWSFPGRPAAHSAIDLVRVATLRRDVSRAAGFPLLLQRQQSALAQEFARRPDLPVLCAQGPATPQHAVFIKRVPLLGLDVPSYVRAYEELVSATYPGKCAADLGLDPAPRIVIDQEVGVWVAAIDPSYLAIASRILQQDLEIKSFAAGHDRYAGLPAEQILDAEIHYGGFERRLLSERGDEPALLGEVVLACGTAGVGNDALLAQALLQRGAALAWLGHPAVEGVLSIPPELPFEDAIQRLVEHYGGLDVLVVLGDNGRDWIQACGPVLALAPRGGRIVAVGAEDAENRQRVRRLASAAQLPAVCIMLPQPSALTSSAARLIAELSTSECARLAGTLNLAPVR
jgi:rhamnose utilization protein RhaD (predicted bifunctional aldolase and dehydrogenase)